jgi:hypothetical protein
MKFTAAAALLAVVVLAGFGVWQLRNLQGDLATDRKNIQAIGAKLREPGTTILAIQVTRVGNECKSRTDAKGRASEGDKFLWVVTTPSGGSGHLCFRSGEQIILVPKTGYTSPLTPPNPAGYPTITATATTVTSSYMYELWLVDSSGNRINKMEDPELEIVQTLVIQ